MPSMPGPLELLVIGALALIVFGPNRLPQIARTVGRAVNEFRRQAADLKAEFDLSLDEEEDDTPAHIDPKPRAEKDRDAKPEQDPDPSPSDDDGPPPGTIDPDPEPPAADRNQS